jgi:hypothetical protein
VAWVRGLGRWRWLWLGLWFWRWFWRWRRRASWSVGVVAVAAGLVGLVIWLLGPGSRWAGGSTIAALHGKERADAVDAVRKTLLAAAGGTAALIGLSFTGRTFYLSRRGHLTDRYTKAIAQLASDKREERLGGIYALEHLMVESPRDHDTVCRCPRRLHPLTRFRQDGSTRQVGPDRR